MFDKEMKNQRLGYFKIKYFKILKNYWMQKTKKQIQYK